MFAAAAVAAAAALTAISTTSAVGSSCEQPQPETTLINSNNNNNINNNNIAHATTKPRPHISWHQYATQRRNSLQRRKFEIDRRIKQASAANNKTNLHQNELKQFQSNSTQKQANTATTIKKNSTVELFDLNEKPTLSYQHTLVESINEDQFELIKLNLGACEQQTCEFDSPIDPAWLKGLSPDVCNEFMRLNNLKTLDLDSSNPLNGSQVEMTDISQALLEYLQTNNLIEESQTFVEPTLIGNHNSLDYKKASKLAAGVQTVSKRPLRRSKQKYDSLRYRWNPRWLRLLRKTTCLPVAIVTLFLLIFTNLSSNWIYIEENQRAGLWAICKSKIDLTSPTILKYSNELNSNANNDNTNTNLTRSKPKKPRPLFDKPKKFEECFAKFLLKDDTHLVVLALVLVGFFFHIIGLVFLVIGLFFSPTNKTLYYYHSAGECLLSSALLLAIDLFAFASLASSQLSNTHYKFGYCFYTNLIISLVTFFYSLLFYLDDFVNEYRAWRKKISEENTRIY